MSHLTSHTPGEVAARDFRLGDYEEDWRSVEGRYPEFQDKDIQDYLDGVKVAYRLQIFGSVYQ